MHAPMPTTAELIKQRARMRRRERATNRLIDKLQKRVAQLREDRFLVERTVYARGVNIYGLKYTRKST